MNEQYRNKLMPVFNQVVQGTYDDNTNKAGSSDALVRELLSRVNDLETIVAELQATVRSQQNSISAMMKNPALTTSETTKRRMPIHQQNIRMK